MALFLTAQEALNTLYLSQQRNGTMTHPYNPFDYPLQETIDKWTDDLPVTLFNIPMQVKIIDPPKFSMTLIEQQKLLNALMQPVCTAMLLTRRSYLSRSVDIAFAESSVPPALV